MSYFSRLAQEKMYDDFDKSCISPLTQLLWRLEDLESRLEDLIRQGASYSGWSRLSNKDIRYLLPEHFGTICDVEKAIDFVKQDLQQIGYDFAEESKQEVVYEFVSAMPLLFDIVSCQQPLTAA